MASVVIKIESEQDLVDAIEEYGADHISAINKSNIDDEYLLAYQFYYCSSSLCYLAFIHKETHEIDYFSNDLDSDEFENIFDGWELEVSHG